MGNYYGEMIADVGESIPVGLSRLFAPFVAENWQSARKGRVFNVFIGADSQEQRQLAWSHTGIELSRLLLSWGSRLELCFEGSPAPMDNGRDLLNLIHDSSDPLSRGAININWTFVPAPMQHLPVNMNTTWFSVTPVEESSWTEELWRQTDNDIFHCSCDLMMQVNKTAGFNWVPANSIEQFGERLQSAVAWLLTHELGFILGLPDDEEIMRRFGEWWDKQPKV